MDAELWLIHKLPSGTEQVLHQTVRVPAAGGQFGFVPIPVETARGNLTVQLTGSIDRYRTPAGTEFLVLSIVRALTGEGLPPAGLTGTTSSVVPMPEPGKPLLFEMPGSIARGAAAGGRGGAGTGGARGGGSGGGAVAAATTGAGGGTVTMRGSGDPQGAAGTGGVRSGGGGRGGGSLAQMTQNAALLEGHQFALQLQIAPVR